MIVSHRIIKSFNCFVASQVDLMVLSSFYKCELKMCVWAWKIKCSNHIMAHNETKRINDEKKVCARAIIAWIVSNFMWSTMCNSFSESNFSILSLLIWYIHNTHAHTHAHTHTETYIYLNKTKKKESETILLRNVMLM